MTLTVALLAVYMCQQCLSIIIDPTSNDPFIDVDLTNDPRGINEITANNTWKMYQWVSNPLNNWGLKMTLNSRRYAFQSGRESKLTIKMDGFCDESDGGDCDAFYAFSIGDTYITFANDFDYGFWTSGSLGIQGIFIYPACNTNMIVTGNASQLITKANAARDSLAGGDRTNWYKLTSTSNGDTFPVTFEFTNDDVGNTFTVRFRSATFRRGLECTYLSSRATGEDFKFYVTPDVGVANSGGEIIEIASFDIRRENTGTDCEFCELAASAHAVSEFHELEVQFVGNSESMNEIDEKPNVKGIIMYAGVTAVIMTLMTVFVSYIVCIKPNYTLTRVYHQK